MQPLRILAAHLKRQLHTGGFHLQSWTLDESVRVQRIYAQVHAYFFPRYFVKDFVTHTQVKEGSFVLAIDAYFCKRDGSRQPTEDV